MRVRITHDRPAHGAHAHMSSSDARSFGFLLEVLRSHVRRRHLRPCGVTVQPSGFSSRRRGFDSRRGYFAFIAQWRERLLAEQEVRGSSPRGSTVVWPRGEALACKVSHTGSSPVTTSGPIAQLGEHLFCKQGVRGSSPRRSTICLDSTVAVRPRGMGKIRVRFPVEARGVRCPGRMSGTAAWRTSFGKPRAGFDPRCLA